MPLVTSTSWEGHRVRAFVCWDMHRHFMNQPGWYLSIIIPHHSRLSTGGWVVCRCPISMGAQPNAEELRGAGPVDRGVYRSRENESARLMNRDSRKSGACFGMNQGSRKKVLGTIIP